MTDLGLIKNIMLQVDHLSKSYGYDPLFEDVSLVVNEGDKIGLIARNGMGKTTLLRIIAGVEAPDDGTVVARNDLRIGFLEQMPQFKAGLTVIDTLLEGDDEVTGAVRDYEQALAANDSESMARVLQRMDETQAWDRETRFKQVLSKLKITDFHQPVEQLSGGQVKRVALAKILIGEPELLILDEPTNHLDIDMIEWLEGFLSRSTMTLIMVTHDRYFLDNVCNRIVELDRQQLFTYDGNYNYYLEKRAERIEAANAQVERARNLLRTELEWMRRQPQARQHKAQYRIDAFYDLKEQARAPRERGDVSLTVKGARMGKKIFTAHHVCKRWGDKVIVDDFNYIFARYERLGIVGDNGVGKSTLIKMLLSLVSPDSGYFEVGTTVRFGYYSQEGMEFPPDKRVIDAVRDIAEEVHVDERTTYSASQFLNQFLFTVPEQKKLISKLSGGEKRRLYLAVTLMRNPNFLILDEPTNDLDISTLEVLEDYLAHFTGCLIVVSHDRFFMDRTVDHTFVMTGNGTIKDFPGNYSEYRAWKQAHEQRSTAAKQPPAKMQRPEKPRDRVARLSYRERQELERLTTDIASLTEEKQSLDALFASGEVIVDMEERSRRYAEITALLDEMEMRWLELDELR